MIVELAPAKANLVLHVGPRRPDELHEICSIFASLELADHVCVEPLGPAVRAGAEPRVQAGHGGDRVECPGVAGPNLATEALAAYRAAAGDGGPPPLHARIEKRIPIAAGLGGGSADAAATLRAADALAARPLGLNRLRKLAFAIGADVPSQLEPRHALVTGAGERVEPMVFPPLPVVLVVQPEGLATGRVYAEVDRRGDVRSHLEPDRVRALAGAGASERILAALENDLEPAARALRPEIAAISDRLRAAGARAAVVSGSGPTVLGVFEHDDAARRAAYGMEGAIVTRLRDAAAPTGVTDEERSRPTEPVAPAAAGQMPA